MPLLFSRDLPCSADWRGGSDRLSRAPFFCSGSGTRTWDNAGSYIGFHCALYIGGIRRSVRHHGRTTRLSGQGQRAKRSGPNVRLKPYVRLPAGNLPEIGDRDGAPGGEFLSVALNPLQLVESDRSQVAFSTMWTGDHRYSLNHEQVAATPITPRYATLSGSLFTANLADHRIPNCHGESL
jgi:hypothetical protein